MKKILPVVFILLVVLAACAAQTPVDPYLAVGQAQATAKAAQQQADYYGAQLTGTANAPIMAVTLTAAEFALSGTQAASTEIASIKTQSAGQTATAVLWTPTPTLTPTPNATMTLVFAAVNAESTKTNLDLERSKATNNFYAVIFPIFLIVLLLGFAYLAVTLSRHYRFKPVQRDQRGLAPLLLDVVDGVISDSDANPNYSTSTALAQKLPVTAYRQFSQRLLQAEIIARIQQNQSQPAKPRNAAAPVQITKPQSLALEQKPDEIADLQKNLLPLPAWDLFRSYQWESASPLPCGVNAHTGALELWDYSKLPHLSVFGMTGSGKSRRFLRPLVASILASNNRVILLGKETDFQPFMEHPNALVIPVYELTERDEALKYAYALEQCVKEQNRRARHLVEVNASTWQRAGYESTFIVLDEIGNALRQMPKDVARISFNHVVSLVNEGRKVGFNVVFSSQRPKSFIDLTTQCGQAVFLVRNDRESGYALGAPGAEQLREGYFFARFGTLKLAGAFEPNDDQILDLLDSVEVKPLAKPDWITGVTQDVVSKSPVEKSSEDQIKELYLGYLSRQETPNLAAIQRAVFGQADTIGGAHFRQIKRVIANLENTPTIITTTAENTVFASNNG